MSWFLRGTKRADPDAPQPEALDQRLPSGAEQFRKSFVLEQIKVDPLVRQKAIAGDVGREMVEALGGRAALQEAGIRNYNPRVRHGLFGMSMDYAPVAALTERIQELRSFDPERFGSLPATVEEYEAEIRRRDKAEEDEIRSLLDRGDSGIAQFGGGMAGAMTDPVNIGLAVLSGGTGTGVRGALTFAAREAALGAAGEVSSILGQQERAERLGSPEPAIAEQLALGAAGGFVLGGAIGGAANYLHYRRTRKQAEAAARPEDVAGIDHETGIASAEAAVREGREPPPVNATLTDDDILRRIIGVESGGRATAQNPNSSARGLGQFIESTWLEMIQRHRPDLMQGRDRASILSLRDDPQLNAELTRRLLEDNRAALANAGAPTDPGSLYLAHFMGSGGAVRALRASAGTPIQSVMSADAIRANSGIRFNGKSFAQFTVADLRGWAAAKMGREPPSGYAGADVPSAPASFAPSQLRRGQTAGDEVVSPGGLRARVEYRVVDLSEIQQATGALQNRDRSRAASDEWVADTAARLDPSQLMPGPFANQGAPVVGPDGMIESGNGRVRVLGRAAETNPDAYAGYVEQIKAAGFEVPDGMQRPVLIAQRTEDWTPDQRRAWVIDNNSAATARMSSAEQAMTDADYLSGPVLDSLQPGARLGSAQNTEFVRRFLGQLPPGERGAFYDKDGSLSVDGLLRLRRALLGRAFGADDIVRLAVESENRAVEGLLRMLEDLAPDWAAMRALAEQGYIRPEFDITDDLMVVVRTIAKARIEDRDGQSVIAAVRDALGQGDMFASNARDPALTDALLGVFYKGDRARSPDASADILRRYTAEAMQRGRPDSPDLLDGTPPSPAEALDAAMRGHDRREPFAMPARTMPEPVEVPDIQALDPAPLIDGTASPAVQRADDALEAELRAAIRSEAVADSPLQDLGRLVAQGADRSVLDNHQAMRAALDDMQSRPETRTMPGFDTIEWHAGRVYSVSGVEVRGTGAALRAFERQAEELAAHELGVPPVPVSRDRQMTIILGPPAAGKSTIANDIAFARKAAILDSDEIKKALPEFDKGAGAAAVHEESSQLADLLAQTMVQSGTNVVLPKVGNSLSSIEKQIAFWRQAGYQIDVVNMAVTPENAYRRMIGRFVATGRLIPPAYIDEVGSKPGLTYRALKEKGAADGYAEIDNNGPAGSAKPVIDRAGRNALAGSPYDLEVGRGAGSERSEPGRAPRPGEPATQGLTDDSIAARITAARADEPQASPEMRALDDTPIPLGDGPDAASITARDLLADLDADEGLIAAFRVCHLGGPAA